MKQCLMRNMSCIMVKNRKKPKEREMEKTIIFFDQFDDFCRKHPFVTVGGALLFCVVSDIILRVIV